MVAKLRMVASAALAWLILAMSTDAMTSVLYRGEWLSVWALTFLLALLFIYASSDRPEGRMKLAAASVVVNLVLAVLYGWMSSKAKTASERMTDVGSWQVAAEAAVQHEQMMIAGLCQTAVLLAIVLASLAWQKWRLRISLETR